MCILNVAHKTRQNASLYGGIKMNWIIYVVVLEETRRGAMQENHTMLITRKQVEKVTGYMMNTA